MKKSLYLVFSLVLVLAFVLSACTTAKTEIPVATESPAGTDAVTTEAPAPAEPPVEIHFYFTSFNKIPETDAIESVEEALNAITVPKINATIKLHPTFVANYTQQINLALQSGEGLDVFHTLGDFPQYVSQNKVIDITDMIDTDAPEAKAIVGETFLKTSTIQGRLYGIPDLKGYALAPVLAYRNDIMQEIGVDPSTIKTVNDLTAVFEKVKAKYPDMIPLAPVNTGVSGLIQSIFGIDYLGDDYYSPKGVLVGDSLTVVDFYQTQEFKDAVTLAREWYNKGLIMKDAATSTSTALELLTSGKAFSYIASYSGNQAYVQISAQSGQDIKMLRVAQPYLGTSSVNSLTHAVASTSKHPEEALKFINLLFTDKDVINLVIYGLEERDYVKTDEDHVKYPDGQDGNTVPYTAQLSCGIVGNQFIQYAMDGTDMADLELWDYENKNSALSPAMGFTFDNSSVSNEVSAVVNVINEYLPSLQTGSVDPEVELPKFIEKLKAAGLDKIIAAKQAQLDEWLKIQ
ncbi:MAG: ABC transporter substrate-binding protein [Anaerolineaceae bacterium]